MPFKQSIEARRFIEVFKYLQKQEGFTVTEVAKKIKTSRPYIQDVLKGRRNPSIRLVNSFCKKYGASPDYVNYGRKPMLLRERKSPNLSEQNRLLREEIQLLKQMIKKLTKK